MKTKKDTTAIGLYITMKREHGYFHVNAHPVTIGKNAWEREHGSGGDVYEKTLRNAPDDVINGLRLGGLQVVSQGNEDRERRLYGFDFVYHDVYHVKQRDANEMAKTLNTIQKRLSVFEDKFGHPATFGAYLARVAGAIGATQLIFANEKNQRATGDYRNDEHSFYSLRDGVWQVDRRVNDWVHELDEKAVDA